MNVRVNSSYFLLLLSFSFPHTQQQTFTIMKILRVFCLQKNFQKYSSCLNLIEEDNIQHKKKKQKFADFQTLA